MKAAAIVSLIVIPLAAGQQAHINLDFDPQADTLHLKPFGTSVISPEVLPDRRVVFRVNAPGAREVSLASGPLTLALGDTASSAGPRKMFAFAKGEDGVWSLTAGPVAPNMYVYKLVIDGATVADPNNTVAGVGNQPPYSMLVVPGEGPAYYDARPVPHGTVTRHIYHSNVTSGERELYVYAPPGYSVKRKYPVLYLLGGSGELAHNWAVEGRANFIMDNLLADHKVLPMLLVMPNNQVMHRGDPSYRERGPDLLEKDLREHVIPLVESTYSVARDRKQRALAGLSMGGGHTQNVGFRSLDLFASFGVFSAGRKETETLSQSFVNAADKSVDLLFVGQGTYESKGLGPTGADTEKLRQLLDKNKIKYMYNEGGNGAHDWGTWRYLLAEKFLPALWRK